MHAYLAGIGFPDLMIDRAADWREAASIARRGDWSHAWWDAEERERKALYDEAAERCGAAELMRALTDAMQATAMPIQSAARAALARAGIVDEELAHVAAGAAAQACHHRALAQAALRDDHPFIIKYRLYRDGRWLLGVFDGIGFVL
jgi:hypothetical protein